ncbi:hypothetical protein ACW23B_20445 [Streptomyces albidoflavus]
MQIRLTVLGPPGGPAAPDGCDVLVTAPPGTPLAAVSGALAQAVQAGRGPSCCTRAGTGSTASDPCSATRR